MTIPLGRPLPDASRDLPGWLRRKRRLPHRFPDRPAIPMRSCSRWGLPCHRRYRRRGALLPHPFTLTTRRFRERAGGLLSVALSLGSPPPGVTRHRVSVEPGLSSNAPFPAPPRSSSRLALGQVERRGGGVNRRAFWLVALGPVQGRNLQLVILGLDPRIHSAARYSARAQHSPCRRSDVSFFPNAPRREGTEP